MSDQTPFDVESVPSEPRGLVTLPSGRKVSKRGLEAMRQGGAKVAQAVRASQAEGFDETRIRTDVRQMAIGAMPGIMRHMIRIATGKVAKAPAVARVQAGKFVAEVGQVEMEQRTAGGHGILSEMSLSDLEQSLRLAADAARDMAAIQGEAQSVDDGAQSLESESHSLPQIGTSEPAPEASELEPKAP